MVFLLSPTPTIQRIPLYFVFWNCWSGSFILELQVSYCSHNTIPEVLWPKDMAFPMISWILVWSPDSHLFSWCFLHWKPWYSSSRPTSVQAPPDFKYQRKGLEIPSLPFQGALSFYGSQFTFSNSCSYFHEKETYVRILLLWNQMSLFHSSLRTKNAYLTWTDINNGYHWLCPFLNGGSLLQGKTPSQVLHMDVL